jgi:hypothetical protein
MYHSLLYSRSQSIIPSMPSIFFIRPDCIRSVLALSSLHLTSSTPTSCRILTTLPPSVYHPPNVLAGTDSTSYSMLHYLPESYITRYGWFAALFQYVAAGLLGDVSARPACGGSRIHQGSRDGHEDLGHDITLTRSDAGGQDRQRTPRRDGGTASGVLPPPAVHQACSGAHPGSMHWRTHLDLSSPTSSWMGSGRLYPDPSWRFRVRDILTSWSSTVR